jgi:hypothetical protein
MLIDDLYRDLDPKDGLRLKSGVGSTDYADYADPEKGENAAGLIAGAHSPAKPCRESRPPHLCNLRNLWITPVWVVASDVGGDAVEGVEDAADGTTFGVWGGVGKGGRSPASAMFQVRASKLIVGSVVKMGVQNVNQTTVES